MLSTWKDEYVPDKNKLPLFGPLDIHSIEEFLLDESQKFDHTYFYQFPYTRKFDDFDLRYRLGKGAYGNVLLVKDKLAETFYAMKAMSKKKIVKQERVQEALNEKRLLQSVNCPFIVYLLYFSQDNSNIYFILPFISGGELYSYLSVAGKFTDNLSKFYAAQVVLAFEYMHRCNIIYRDLKPENVLVDHFGYIKITDFGLSKVVRNRTYTFCGTPEFMAPEIVMGEGYGTAADWWSLGVFIYEMSSGYTPFITTKNNDTLARIVIADYNMPKAFEKDLKDLIQRFLQRDVTKRIGNLKSGVEEIKNHPWFNKIEWLPLFNRRVVPPYVPADTMRISPVRFPDTQKLSNLKIEKYDKFQEYFLDF